MKHLAKTLIALFILTIFFSQHTQAAQRMMLNKEQAMQLIQPFYDFFEGKSTEAQVRPSFSSNWKSFYGNGAENYKTLDQTLGFLGGPFREMVPNLKWEIKDVLLTDDYRIVVRGEGSGTPAGEKFMGVPVSAGASFKVMSIDIHTVEDGKIVSTYHIESWANAFKQLAPKK